MLTVKHRNRLIDPHLDQALQEESTDIERNASVIEQVDDEELLRRIDQINEENERVRRENFLFSCYLRRKTTTKIIETFDDYFADNEILLEITDEIKLPETSRRLSLKMRRTSVWTKAFGSGHEHRHASFLSRIEQERLAIADYEITQTDLDWQRMKENARIVLNHQEFLYRLAESDRVVQETLKRDFERTVEKYRINYGVKGVPHSYSKIPADLVVNRIQKRLRAHVTTISLLRVSTARVYTRIQEMRTDIRNADDMSNVLDGVSIDLMKEAYAKVNRQYHQEKSFQYPLVRSLHDSKKLLTEQKTAIHDMQRKWELLQNDLERTALLINEIERENQRLVKENSLLKDRLESVIKVPTITDYAHIIEQMRILEHGIDIWTKRVNIAETLSAQRPKPPRFLPPL